MNDSSRFYKDSTILNTVLEFPLNLAYLEQVFYIHFEHSLVVKMMLCLLIIRPYGIDVVIKINLVVQQEGPLVLDCSPESWYMKR